MELPKFSEPYNHKLDTRMIINSNIYRDRLSSYEGNVWVYDKQALPINAEQEEVLKSRVIYDLWKEKGITVDSIVVASKEFNILLEDDKISRLETFLDEIKECSVFEYACKFYMFVVKRGIFGLFSTKFAIIALNAILVRNNILPIIVYTNYAIMLAELIQAGLMLESLEEMIYQNFQTSIIYNNKHKLISQKEVLNTLKKHKETIRTVYGVKKLYLMGSYAKNTVNEYSDLDIIVDIQDRANEAALEAFISEKVHLPVDIVNINERFAQCKDNIDFKLEVF